MVFFLFLKKNALLLIFVTLFTIFFFTASGNIDSIDGTTHISLARELVAHQKLDFGNGPLARSLNAAQNETTGKFYTYYNFGYSLFFVPGVLTSIGIRRILRVPLPNFPFEQDWIIISYANLVNGLAVALIGVVLYCLHKRLQGNKHDNPIFGILIPILIISTHLFIEAHNHFPHPIFSLFFLLSLYFLLEKRMVKFSLMFLVTASIYNVTFVFLLPALYSLYLLPLLKKKKQSIVKEAFIFTMYVLPAFIMQVSWNYIRFGKIGYTGYSSNVVFSLSDIIMRIWGMTFAPNMGIFVNNPIILFAVVIAIYNIFRKNKYSRISMFFVVLCLSYIVGYSLSDLWHASTVYGPRFHTPLLPVGILLICMQWDDFSKRNRMILYCLVCIGIFIQIPGILIPNFAFPFLSPAVCNTYVDRYYNPKCAPVKVGWSNIIKRRMNETLITLRKPTRPNEISSKWPQPPKPFRTIYPDPLFNRFSSFKTEKYKIPKQAYNDIYSFAFDIWWIKIRYYTNILP